MSMRLSVTLSLALSAAMLASCTTSDEGDDPQLDTSDADGTSDSRGGQEKFLYVVAINQGSVAGPDMLLLIGTDPRDTTTFGKVFKRVDLPNVGDEVHHFNYSLAQDRLIIPGLFSNRIHVLDVTRPKEPRITAVSDTLAADSGYAVPHTLIGVPGHLLLSTMIGAATADTRPGGVVLVSDRTGKFVGDFGPGPARDPSVLGPDFMYDIDINLGVNRAVSTTFGPPAACAPAINPGCLGDEVAVWDFYNQKVIQTESLGANSGALESRWVGLNTTFGYTNAAGTSAMWLWEDEDHDGTYDFHQVLGPEDGLNLPADIILSGDRRFMYVANWFGSTVQMFDIKDRFHPVLVDEVPVPHANMLRLSRDGRRLYATNSLISTWDNDPAFGPPRNTEYGVWLFGVDTRRGTLTSVTADGSAWVKTDAIQKKNGVGAAGPHMMLFDPSVPLGLFEH